MELETQTLYNKGKELAKSKKYNDALRYFDKAMKMDPKNSELYIEKGNTLLAMGKSEEAIYYYSIAININPKSVEARKNKGDACLIIGDYSEALKCYDEFTQLDSKNETAWLTLGIISLNLYLFHEAKRCFEKVLELNPNSQEAKSKMNALHKEAGVISSAETTKSMNKKPKQKFIKKICILGYPAVGKTSLIRRYVLDLFDDKYIATLGAKVREKTITITQPAPEPDIDLTLMIWDIFGQKVIGDIHQTYYRGADASFVVCDLTRKNTFHALPIWIDDIFKITGEIPIVFIANKNDLGKQEFGVQELKSISETFKAPYFLTSAKTGENVEGVFTALGKLLVSSS